MNVRTDMATLATYGVTIRALHVSNKQMSLAFFRQLPVALEKEGDELWGVVYCHVKDVSDRWLVFVSEDCLYRRAVNPIAEINQYVEWIGVLQRQIAALDSSKQEKRQEKQQEIKLYEDQVTTERARAAWDSNTIATLPQLFIAI